MALSLFFFPLLPFRLHLHSLNFPLLYLPSVPCISLPFLIFSFYSFSSPHLSPFWGQGMVIGRMGDESDLAAWGPWEWKLGQTGPIWWAGWGQTHMVGRGNVCKLFSASSQSSVWEGQIPSSNTQGMPRVPTEAKGQSQVELGAKQGEEVKSRANGEGSL